MDEMGQIVHSNLGDSQGQSPSSTLPPRVSSMRRDTDLQPSPHYSPLPSPLGTPLITQTAPETPPADPDARHSAYGGIEDAEEVGEKEDDQARGTLRVNTSIPEQTEQEPDLASPLPTIATPSSPNEATRPRSTITTETDRSSQSSSSWKGNASGSGAQSRAGAASTTSLYTNGSNVSATPQRSPGLGTAFRSKFFPSSTASSSSGGVVVDGTSFLSMSPKQQKKPFPSYRAESSSGKSTKSGRSDRSVSDGKAAEGHKASKASGESGGKSEGSSSSSTGAAQTRTPKNDSSSPRTPRREKKDKTSPNNSSNSKGSSKSGSATARFLRRVVSAPNTKSLLLFGSNNNSAADIVPPLPKSPHATSNAANTSKAPDSPKVLLNGQDEVDLTPGSATPNQKYQNGHGNVLGIASPGMSNLSAPSAKATRGQRSLTVGGNAKKEAQAALGVASSFPSSSSAGAVGESRHKAVFKRTYSSNSIKTRSVEVTPSSFQKIKLLGKGDVGKVYLVKEKKTDKLFAMKGESIAATH